MLGKVEKVPTKLNTSCQRTYEFLQGKWPGAQLDILLWGGQGGKFFFATPLNIFRGGQEKCVLYSNNKKLTLPTGYSVSQDS